MLQLEFPHTVIEPRRARATDPDTSHAAARSVRLLANDQQAEVLACLKANGPMGKDGIAARSKLTAWAVSRRLPELQRLGLVKLTGGKVPSLSGRQEREWEAVA